jgi:hypothetical protein
MFIHTLESLEEFEDYIKQLEETVGLSTETYQEVTKAISKERDKLNNLSLSGVVVSKAELCDCNNTVNPNYDPCCSYSCWSKKFD